MTGHGTEVELKMLPFVKKKGEYLFGGHQAKGGRAGTREPLPFQINLIKEAGTKRVLFLPSRFHEFETGGQLLFGRYKHL